MMKKHLAISALAAWVILVIGFMMLARTLDLEIFFVLWLIRILIIVGSPLITRPRRDIFQY